MMATTLRRKQLTPTRGMYANFRSHIRAIPAHTHSKDAAQLGDMPMDATTCPDSECANRAPSRAIPFLHLNPAPITIGAEVSVMILYADPVIAAGLAAVLRRSGGFQIVSTPEPGDVVCGPLAADVVVADYETAMRLAQTARHWAKKVVVFTNYDSEAQVCRALESGASGYLMYGVGLPELCEGIRSVRDGGVALSPQAAARITNRFQGETLTPREKAVLEQLMLGLRDKVIARKLNLGVGTVKCHVKAILCKLEADSRTAAVIAAQRRGLLP
jgi:DNA-binding NarL/FixJ family response regulator